MRILHFIIISIAFVAPKLLSAQLSDNFSDGDFSSNPTWNGTSELFSINASGQLQTIATAADTALLFTSFSNTSLSNKEWQFFIRQSFAGSANNNSRVYLTASGIPLNLSSSGSAGVQGYFLRFGETGSADAIRLFRDNGSGAPTELAACTAGAISASFSARVKVTRSDAGLWAIFVDYTGGTTFVQEATATDTQFTTSANLGVICSFTSSNADNFFFDDFYFGDFIIDTTPPSANTVQAINANQLEVTFSEAVNATATSTSNYFITGNINPTSASISVNNPALVTLSFASSFPANSDLEITISNVQDLAGNSMSSASLPFTFFVPATPSFRSVVFNEVLADPSPPEGLPEAEFVELHNPTDQVFNLENWSLVNSTTARLIPAYTLPPNGYVVLTNITNVSLFSNAIGITSFTALTNSTDSLTLLDNTGNIVDILVYSDDWFASSDKADGGWTLEQINPNFPCSAASNWAESNSPTGGTPALQNSIFNDTPDTAIPTIVSLQSNSSNSILITFNETMNNDLSGIDITITPNQGNISLDWLNSNTLRLETEQSFGLGLEYSIFISGPSDCSGNSINNVTTPFIIGFQPEVGDLLITEIMAAPQPDVNAYSAEYIEIYNLSNKLLDLSQVRVNNGIFTQSRLLAPGAYLAIASVNNATALSNISNIAFMTSFPGLTNSGTTLTLTHSSSGILDEVTYADDWYNDTSKDDGGWSLELINPNDPCSGPDNWTASVNPAGGTPGEQNSVFNDAADTSAPIVSNFSSIGTNTISLIFNEPMNIGVLDFNITIEPNQGNFLLAWLNSSTLTIQTEQPFETGEFYNISITGPSDCWGNTIENAVVPFIIGFTPEIGDLIITEIMAAPSSTIGAYSAEYAEIFNKSNKILDISDVIINSGILVAPRLLQPGEYLAIADIDAITELTDVTNIAYMEGFPSLSNAGTTVTLGHPSSGILDVVSYTAGWYKDPSKSENGWSLELINLNDPCSSEDNWRASVSPNGGTPGAQNSVIDNSPDIAGPQISNIFSGGAFAVIIKFNEPLDEASILNFSWIVDGVQTTPASVSFSDDSNTSITITISGSVASQIYSFILPSIQDCWGNASVGLSGVYAVAEPAEVGDIVINEILSNPFEGGSDFVEVYNTSDKVILLQDWSFATERGDTISSIQTITDQGLIILPKNYKAFTEDGNELPVFYPFTKRENVYRVNSLPAYNNAEGTVYLLSPNQTVMDRVDYVEDMHFVLLEDLKGVSLERIDPSRPSDDITNWGSAAESQGYATPGYQNSQALAAILGEEDINVFPEIFSPDNDGFQDVVTFTFQNTKPGMVGNIYIFDSNGRQVLHLLKNSLIGENSSVSWDGRNADNGLAPIGIYIVYIEVFDENGNTSKIKKTCVLAHQLD